MEQIFYFYIIAGITAIVAVVIYMTKKSNSSLRARLKDRFGKKPYGTEDTIDSISSYHHYTKENVDTSKHIDDITWNDLDMDKVFSRINACQTSAGEECLYQLLHEPKFEKDELQKREKLIEYFSEHPNVRTQVQMYLAKLGKSQFNGISSFIYNPKSKEIKNAWLYIVLTILPIISIVLMILNGTTGLILLAMSVVTNAYVYYRKKLKMEKDLAAIRYFSTMLWSTNKILKVPELDGKLDDLRKQYSVFKSLRSKTSSIMQKGASELEFMTELIKMLFLMDIRKYNRIIGKIVRESDAFHKFYMELSDIDIAISILSYRRSVEVCCKPTFHKDNGVVFDDLYHPLLDEPVLNSDQFTNDCIITGPNASGKSTFIKALAINGILAQTINTCTAEKFMTRYSLVMTSMAVKDDITKGDSYYITEIKSLKRIIEKVKDIRCTCFVDEILRGTNTIERIAASTAVLRHLHKMDCLSIVASHDIELTEILKDEYNNYHFSDNVGDNEIYFDYKLHSGCTTTRNAIKLLDFIGFDEDIVKEANKKVEKFDTTNAW